MRSRSRASSRRRSPSSPRSYDLIVLDHPAPRRGRRRRLPRARRRACSATTPSRASPAATIGAARGELRLRRPLVRAPARRRDAGAGAAPGARRRPARAGDLGARCARSPPSTRRAVARRAARPAHVLLDLRRTRRVAVRARARRGSAAFAILEELAACSLPSLRDANPIELLEAHGARARGRAAARSSTATSTTRAPAAGARRCASPTRRALGSTLGGTGIALTRRCPLAPELAEHLRVAARSRHPDGVHPRAPGPAGRPGGLERPGARRELGRLLLGHAAHDRGRLGAPALPGLHRVPEPRLGADPRRPRPSAIPAPRLLDRLDALWRASLPTGAVL